MIYTTDSLDIIHSNACKFTPAGGKLFVSTRLVLPSPSKYAPSEGSGYTHVTQVTTAPATPAPSATDPLHSLSEDHLSQHNLHHSKPRTPLEWIVVRIEVTDTGCGIKPRDIAQSKLFCKSFRYHLRMADPDTVGQHHSIRRSWVDSKVRHKEN
jgi:signal transduction histidine kinase